MNIDITTKANQTFYTLKTGHKDLVTGMVMVPAGLRYQKFEDRILPAILLPMLTRSSKNRSEDQIGFELESKGIKTSSFNTPSFIGMNFTCRKGDLDKTLAVLAEMMQKPALKEDEFNSLKARLHASIQMDTDEPKILAGVAFCQALFGAESINAVDHPDTELALLEGLTIEQVRKFHASFDCTQNASWVAAGDIYQETFTSLVEKHFKPTHSKTLDIKRSYVAGKPRKHNKVHIPVPAKQSVHLLIGQSLDIDIHHADYWPLRLAVDALGGSFSARLMRTVRDEDGLTYSVGAMMGGFNIGEKGYWRVFGAFSPKLLDKGIASITKQLKIWYKDGITQEELDERKKGMIGRYKVGNNAVRALVGHLPRFIEQGFGAEELVHYPTRIESVTLEQVNAVIKQYIDLDQLLQVTSGTLD